MDLKEATDIANFILQLKVRNPYYLEKTLNKNKDSWINASAEEISVNFLSNNSKYSHIPVELRKVVFEMVVGEKINNPNGAKELQLTSIIDRYQERFDFTSKSVEAILSSRWLLFEAPLGVNFITSDNPGVSITNNNSLVYNTKFNDNFWFYFPLSPKHCLVITDQGIENNKTRNDVKIISKVYVNNFGVIAINDKSIQLINELLIASDDKYLKEIARINAPPK